MCRHPPPPIHTRARALRAGPPAAVCAADPMHSWVGSNAPCPLFPRWCWLPFRTARAPPSSPAHVRLPAAPTHAGRVSSCRALSPSSAAAAWCRVCHFSKLHPVTRGSAVRAGVGRGPGDGSGGADLPGVLRENAAASERGGGAPGIREVRGRNESCSRASPPPTSTTNHTHTRAPGNSLVLAPVRAPPRSCLRHRVHLDTLYASQRRSRGPRPRAVVLPDGCLRGSSSLFSSLLSLCLFGLAASVLLAC